MLSSCQATRSSFRTKCSAAMKPVGDGPSDEPTAAARQHAGSRHSDEEDDGPGADSITISRTLLQRMLRYLRGADAKIYLALCMRSGPDGMAQAAVAELARIAGVGVRTVYGSLQRLEKAGLVRLESKVGGSTANTYRVYTDLNR
jgi:DNA-binding transcriptional ArsR family regulator